MSVDPEGWTERLPRDYRDILGEFVAAGVEFLVIGAWAMAAHGHVRATKDIGLFVFASPDNAERVMRALAAFGAPLEDVSAEDFASPGVVFQIGVKDRVDVTTTIHGPDFQTVQAHKLAIRLGEIEVPFIGLDALIANKRASGRPQDLVDVEALEKMLFARAKPRG